MKKFNVVIMDPIALYRKSLATLLSDFHQINIIASVGCFLTLDLVLTCNDNIDLVITETYEEGSLIADGACKLRNIVMQNKGTKFIIFTTNSNKSVLLQSEINAAFFKNYSIDKLRKCFDFVSSNQIEDIPSDMNILKEMNCQALSKSEWEVLQSYCANHGTTAVSNHLGKPYKTVSRIKRSIMSKLRITNNIGYIELILNLNKTPALKI